VPRKLGAGWDATMIALQDRTTLNDSFTLLALWFHIAPFKSTTSLLAMKSIPDHLTVCQHFIYYY
jgi:hypothetical protein